MKIKLKKDLPDYPAGTIFKHDGSKWRYDDNFPVSTSVAAYLDDYTTTSNTWECLNYSDWFERVDETPLYWEPEEDEYFYLIHMDSGIDIQWFNTSELWHRKAVRIGNAFPTREAAQAHVKYLKALTRVRKYIQEQGFELGEYHGKPTPIHTVIVYDHTDKKFLRIGECNSQAAEVLPLFKDPDDSKQVIDNCQDDLKTIFGVES